MAKTLSPAEILAKYDLDDLDRRILTLKVKHPLMTDAEVGKVCGVARGTVNKRRRKEAYAKAYSEYLLPAHSLLESKADNLLRKYLKLADCNDVKVQERVLRTLLISLGVLKNRVSLDQAPFEMQVIHMPTFGESIKVVDVRKAEALPESSKDG